MSATGTHAALRNNVSQGSITMITNDVPIMMNLHGNFFLDDSLVAQACVVLPGR